MTVSLVWICLFAWTAASAQNSPRAVSTVLYPKINGTETLNCACPDHTCQEVFWFRYLENSKSLQFLMYLNSAGTEKHESDVMTQKPRFKGSVTSGSIAIYSLRVTALQKDEAGLYSCLFKTKTVIPAGYYIRPGVSPPTLQPPLVTTKKPRRFCRACRSNSPQGCERSVLWPGIGALLLLAVILAGTLYYFSRLPKKCRHRFTKTNPLQ